MTFLKILWPAVAAFALAGSPAASSAADPIGSLEDFSQQDKAHGVYLAKDMSGRPVCFSRETGDSHHLDIGISTNGPFIRLEAFDDGDAMPQGSVRLYAGRQHVIDDKATEQFDVLATVKGKVQFIRLTSGTPGFLVLAKSDSSGFLETVAAARENFLVVEEISSGRVIDYVAVYEFTKDIAAAVDECAREAHIESGYSGLSKTLPAGIW